MTAPGLAPELVPELGPLLGRVAVPEGPASGLVPLDDIRLTLVTELFDLAGAAREFAASGDVSSAVQSLNRQGWLAAWERAVDAAAERVAGRIDARLRSAAAESRLPKKRLARALLIADERRGIAVRIGIGGAGLIEALDTMEPLARRASRDPAGVEAWRAAIAGVARRTDSAWAALEQAAAREEAAWQEDITQLRAWRRPRLPLWIITFAVLALALWLGLMLGGFVSVPGFMRPLAEWWWSLG
jgi:hypothetical protein